MTLDTLTIVVTAVLILMALITPMLNPFFRRLKKDPVMPTTDLPHLTVLLVSNGDHTALDEHLPIYLTQDYSPGYDVIVVSEKADAESENVLKRYSQNERLYHTFVPESSRYMSKNKLAITLGVKASKSEWIVLTDPRCKPQDSHWLSSLASSLDDETNMLLGYSNYASESLPYHRFERLHTALYILREAQKGKPYRTNCFHVTFRKSEFMSGSGFVEYLKYSIGEYDFLVNKYARPYHTKVVLDESTWLTEDPISNKSWQNRQVYFHEVSKHIEGGIGARFLHGLDQWALHLNYMLILAGFVYGGMTTNWIILGASFLSLVITNILRTMIGKRALKEYHVDLPSWKIIPYEWSMLRHSIQTRLRYEYADKNDFIAHKV